MVSTSSLVGRAETTSRTPLSDTQKTQIIQSSHDFGELFRNLREICGIDAGRVLIAIIVADLRAEGLWKGEIKTENGLKIIENDGGREKIPGWLLDDQAFIDRFEGYFGDRPDQHWRHLAGYGLVETINRLKLGTSLRLDPSHLLACHLPELERGVR